VTDLELVAREIFQTLGRRGIVDAALAERLARMVGFRNILVHNYVEFDVHLLQEVLQSRLADLDDFGAATRRRLPPPPKP
jgi:uncharacterized protein YutE (UPF0331/DUF86 family)